MGRDVSRIVALVLVAGAGLAVLALFTLHTGLAPVPTGEYQEQQLRVTDCAGTERGAVTVAVADSFEQRYVGLSRTESLATDEGLVLVFEDDGPHRIGMRNMDFDLDVLFVSADGEITRIETLEAPDSVLESSLLYESTSGHGRYVLEVQAGWSEERGVGAGDCVVGLP